MPFRIVRDPLTEFYYWVYGFASRGGKTGLGGTTHKSGLTGYIDISGILRRSRSQTITPSCQLHIDVPQLRIILIIVSKVNIVHNDSLLVISLMNYPLRVHIAPVGYDIDRVVLPLERMAADRVWLVKERNEAEDDGLEYYQGILNDLQNKLPRCEVKIKTCDLINRDLFDILRAYREIIEEESRNQIYINVSTGTKIHSIAGMLVSMIFKEEKSDIYPYYVVPEDYNGKTANDRPLVTGCKDINSIPSYKIERPREELITVLKVIETLTLDGTRLTKNVLIEKLDEIHYLEFQQLRDRSRQDTTSAKYRALDRKYVQPLVGWNFIEVVGTGTRKEIQLTMEGRNILKFLG